MGLCLRLRRVNVEGSRWSFGREPNAVYLGSFWGRGNRVIEGGGE